MTSGQVDLEELTRDGLTPKQEAFCCFYRAMRNGTQAALKAYPDQSETSAAVTAYDNLRNPKIVARLADLQAQEFSATHLIASVTERKAILSEIMRARIETPISAGHKVAATKELNLMEKVYTESHDRPQVVSISYVFNQAPQALPAIDSAKSPLDVTITRLEADNIT